MFDKKSDYAVNKQNQNRIVYQSVLDVSIYAELKDGIVYECYIDHQHPEENSIRVSTDMTAESFAYFKKLSDEDYYDTDRDDIAYYQEKCSLFDEDSSEEFHILSAQDELIERYDRILQEQGEKEQLSFAKKVLDSLTPTQRRRYLKYTIGGKSTRKIAKEENVTQNQVWKSVKYAENKIFSKKPRK